MASLSFSLTRIGDCIISIDRDALELSDDSDIEVHPNVDKRSFIRAKQNQIHQERLQRKHEITTLKYERIVNDGLLTRIDRLLDSLKIHLHSAEAKEKPDEIVFQSLLESSGDPSSDQPPPRPEGVHEKVEEQPTYSKMIAALVDQVKKTVDEEKKPQRDLRLNAFVDEVGVHKTKVLDLQQQLLKRLAELEKLEGSKITSESIHTGFDTSHVAKKDAPKAQKSAKAKSTSTATELLNPASTSHAESNPELDSGSEADVEEDYQPTADPNLSSPIPERTIHATKLGLAFADLPSNDYQAYLRFIAQNPEVLQERETDGLLMRAFDLQYAGREKESKQSVHQALLLQYCRSLGKDGVAMFFKRITTKDHQARNVFYDDVNSTYAKLRDRAREMAKETAAENGEGGDVEQIQLHAVNPGQKINIAVPPELNMCSTDEERQSRAIFDSFPPGLQKALGTADLDEVNKVLGKMPVSEAEEVVGKLSEGGMLSLEEGVVDATTEEGRARLEEYEKQGKEYRIEEVEGEPGEQTEDAAQKLAVDEVD